MNKLFLLQALISILFFGCTEATHDFNIRFNSINGLLKGSQVHFMDTVIGDVKNIEYTDSGSYLVDVSLKKEFAPTVTDLCKFYIDEDSSESAKKIIRVVRLEDGGNQIKEGDIVDGTSKYSVIYDQFSHQLSQKIYNFETEINDFFEELKDFSENEQINEIERQLDKILDDLGSMSLEMKNKLELEVLPYLREKIEELRKRLEKNGQEDKLQYVDQKIEIISDNLQIQINTHID